MPELGKALVTGASSGIGAAAARALADSGREVLALARRKEKLDALANETGASVLAVDICRFAEFVPAIREFSPDIIVNNAGVGHGIDGLEGIDSELIQTVVDTNIAAPIKITAAVLPFMRSRNRGHIVNIGSIAGLHTITSALYGATKSAIHIFSQNLRNELLGSRIRVTEICPGRVTSEFYKASQGNRERLDQLGRTAICELSPEDVAQSIMFAVNAPNHVNIATIELLPTQQAVGGVRMADSAPAI